MKVFEEITNKIYLINIIINKKFKLMKRNFLLMLLLTLLPLAGWATIGDFTLTSGDEPDGNNYVLQARVGEEAQSVTCWYFDTETTPAAWVDVTNNVTWYQWDATLNDNAGGYSSTAYSGDFVVGKYQAVYGGLSAELTVYTEETPEQQLVEVQVKPVSGAEMPYGTPAEQFTVNKDMVSITVAKFLTDAGREQIAGFLKVNEAAVLATNPAGTYLYSLGLKDKNTCTITEGNTTYYIKPVDDAQIVITKGKNKLVDGLAANGTPFETITGIPYNGSFQDLVRATSTSYTFASFAGEADDAAALGTGTVAILSVDRAGAETISKVKVLTNEAAGETQQADADNFVDAEFYVKADPSVAPTGKLQIYNKVEEEYVGTGMYVTFSPAPAAEDAKYATFTGAEDKGAEFFAISKTDFDALYTPEATEQYQQEPVAVDIPDHTTWNPNNSNVEGFTPTWNTTFPQGKDIDQYYVYVRAVGGASNYDAGDVKYLGVATIVKGTPTFAGTITGVASKYYVDTHTDLKWKGIHGSKDANNNVVGIVPSVAELTINGEAVDAQDVTFFVQVGNKTGNTIAYAWETESTWQTRKLENFGGFEEGYYRILAYFNGNDNYNPAGLEANEERVAVEFQVVRPKVTVTTTSKTETIAFGTTIPEDQFGYSANWTTSGYADEFAEEPEDDAHFDWYSDEACEESASSNKAGVFYVLVDDEDFDVDDDFDIEFKPVMITVLQGDIFAEIKSYTEDKALVFGQELPLKLDYDELNSGAFAPDNTEAIERFENVMWPKGFKAKMIQNAEGENVEDGEEIDLFSEYSHTQTTGGTHGTPRVETKYYTTTILPVGTWTITFEMNNDEAPYNFSVAHGTWTVKAKDINNEDFGNWRSPNDQYDTPEPRVKGMGGRSYVKPVKLYTSEDIELTEGDLDGKFTYRAGRDFLVIGDDDEPGGQLHPLPAPLPVPVPPVPAINKHYTYGSLVLDRDFEITSYTNNRHAGTATYHVKGIGNFKGEKDLTFTIKPATIYVYPVAAEWAVGDPEVDDDGNSIYAIDWENDKIDTYTGKPIGVKDQLKAFKNDRNGKLDLTTANGFKDLTVRRHVGATASETPYPNGLIAYLPKDAEPAQDYTFEPGYGELTINKGLIKLQLAAQEVEYDGNNKKALTESAKAFAVTPGQKLTAALEENWPDVVSIDWEQVTLSDNRDETGKFDADKDGNVVRYPAGKYTITLAKKDGATIETVNDAFTSTNYDVDTTGTTADLTVTPVEITLTAIDCTVDYATFVQEAADWNADPKNADNPKTAEQCKAAFITAYGTKVVDKKTVVDYDKATVTPAEGLKTPDTKADVITSIAINAKNEIEVTANETNKNYKFGEPVKGTFTITPLPGLVLYSEPAVTEVNDDDEEILLGGDWKKLVDNNNAPVSSVTIYFKQGVMTTGSGETVPFEWKTDEWMALVLPFDVNTRDISNAFGYAIVNVVDPENTVKDNVKFKFMKISKDVIIPANTPFVLKTDEDIDLTAKDANNNVGFAATFDQHAPYTITLPTDATGKPVKRVSKAFENEWGYTIDGTYEAMQITGDEYYLRFLGNNEWNKIKKGGKSVFNMQPYYGFVNLGADSETREVIFTFEEEDGTTTAIKAVDFMNGNKANAEGLYRIDGIKLQSAPTQKGVYIQDGKKFVK